MFWGTLLPMHSSRTILPLSWFTMLTKFLGTRRNRKVFLSVHVDAVLTLLSQNRSLSILKTHKKGYINYGVVRTVDPKTNGGKANLVLWYVAFCPTSNGLRLYATKHVQDKDGYLRNINKQEAQPVDNRFNYIGIKRRSCQTVRHMFQLVNSWWATSLPVALAEPPSLAVAVARLSLISCWCVFFFLFLFLFLFLFFFQFAMRFFSARECSILFQTTSILVAPRRARLREGIFLHLDRLLHYH